MRPFVPAVVVTALVASLALSSAPAHAMPAADLAAGGGQSAFADFAIEPEGVDGFAFVFVGVSRGAGADLGDSWNGTSLHVAIDECHVVGAKKRGKDPGAPVPPKKGTAKGKDEKKRKDRFRIECTWIEHEADIPIEDFQVDPLLRTATLRTEIAGSTIELTWTGRGEVPEAGTGAYLGNGYADAGVTAGRSADVEGVVLGHRVSSPADEEEVGCSYASGAIMEGAGGYAHTGEEKARFGSAHRDGENERLVRACA